MPPNMEVSTCLKKRSPVLPRIVRYEGFDTSGNPVRQCRNQLEITEFINGNQLEIEVINQKSRKIWSGAREGTCGNRLINRP